MLTRNAKLKGAYAYQQILGCAGARVIFEHDASQHLPVLPFSWRYGIDFGRERRMNYRINRPVLYLGASWIFAKKIIAFPIHRRSNWSGNKTTTAVRADVSQNAIDTGRTKGAFIAANACVNCVGRQCNITVFACGSEF
jgi:hypothetical protein